MSIGDCFPTVSGRQRSALARRVFHHGRRSGNVACRFERSSEYTVGPNGLASHLLHIYRIRWFASASEAEVSAATVALQGAQRDRIIASYTLLSAIGHLDVKTLGLNTPDYLPEAHYHQVRDSWGGLRTPSGR